ncbi:MAG TPA: 2-dehydropantoate 2-reductase [Thermoplasmata archaeon]|nr:2-dehydropantoate 2-reductase [Thermoplasmata archaeon]
MRICVFGAGSMGSALGGLLAEGHEVVLVGRKANVDRVRQDGLRLQGAVNKEVMIDARETVSDIDPPDLLVIATKAYSTQSVIEACRDWVASDTIVLTLQNGLGNLEKLRDWRGAQAIGGTTTMGALLIEPGVVDVASLGSTFIGADVDPETAEALASMFAAAGMPTKVTVDIQAELWAKATINACINPMTAILRVANGEIARVEALSMLVRDISQECEAVADACGIRLPYESMYQQAMVVAKNTASNRSSMLRDIELGRRTEIQSINGHICRAGLHARVPTPINNALVALVESLGDHQGGERLIS